MSDLLNFFIFILIVFITAAVYLVIYIKWKHTYWQRKGVIQLKPDFFYGNTKGLIFNEKSYANTYDEIYQKFKIKKIKYGGLYTLNRNILFLLDLELIKRIMCKDFEYFTAHMPKVESPTIFRKGLFHLGGEEWKDTRKKLTPTFTSVKMKMMYEIVLEKVIKLQNLAAEIVKENDGEVNLVALIDRFTIDVIATCGFGIECNTMKDPNSTFLKYVRLILSPLTEKESLWSILQRALWKQAYFFKDLEATESFFLDTVKRTIEYREKNQIYRKDFLQLMMELKNYGIVSDISAAIPNANIDKINGTSSKYSMEDITAQCLLFLAAGYDTSANTITFTLLELSRHEEIQQKIREEYKTILKKYDGKMTYEAMLELKYTECVIDEALRLYPPIAGIPRTCTKSYKIPNTDIIIEKDTDVIIPAWSIHRDPDYFTDPEKFDPERFNDENKNKIKDFSYFPFGDGPRMCLGYRFAKMQIKLALSMLLNNYKIMPNKKTTLPLKIKSGGLITRAAGNLIVNFKKINENDNL